MDFIEALLVQEYQTKQQCSRSILTRMARFPAIKTLEQEQYDMGYGNGVPRFAIEQLVSLAFIEQQENVIRLGPSGVGKTHIAIA